MHRLRRSTAPAPPAASIAKLAEASVTDRAEALLELAAGRRVIHVGFVDVGRVDEKQAGDTWLHARLADSLKQLGLPPADLLIAGEIIEHLENTGSFLEAVKPLVRENGELVVTTPNPHALTNVLFASTKREVQNVDHVAWHSWKTLETLLGRHGWTVTSVAYYVHPRYVARNGAPPGERLKVAAFNAYQTVMLPVFRLMPTLADGIIVRASAS